MGLVRRAARRVLGNELPLVVPLTAAQVGSAGLRLAIAGDVGHPSAELELSVAAMVDEHARRPFDALVLLGDNIYPDGDPARVGEAVLDPLAPILGRGVVLVAVLGNHDVDRGQPDEVARRLGMPARWYERQFGPVQLLALDSTRAGDREQGAWLERTLAGSDATFRVVALHHPPYSAGWHGSSRDVRRSFGPAFVRHGVDLVLAGHEHDYQRSKPISGTVYIVSGAATHLRATGKRRFTAAAHARHHFLDLWVIDQQVIIQPVGHDRQPFDQTVLPIRGALASRSTWSGSA
ncbi:MAG TPA: metallophosphoesterase [Acidimicrobiales bacterium]|jgi:3',5'-cyclic AMP phosphodiesterase CpdA|nr:metallophosphoesterase [Acidimicrobiales bacterium]